MAFNLANTAANDALSAAVALANGGGLRFYTSTGTQLVSCPLAATAFGTCGATSAGVATANTITDGVVAASGQAGYCSIVDSSGDGVITSMSVNTSGADVNMTNINFEVSDVVSINYFKVALPLT